MSDKENVIADKDIVTQLNDCMEYMVGHRKVMERGGISDKEMYGYIYVLLRSCRDIISYLQDQNQIKN